jgi:hypothetical protein
MIDNFKIKSALLIGGQVASLGRDCTEIKAADGAIFGWIGGQKGREIVSLVCVERDNIPFPVQFPNSVSKL